MGTHCPLAIDLIYIIAPLSLAFLFDGNLCSSLILMFDFTFFYYSFISYYVIVEDNGVLGGVSPRWRNSNENEFSIERYEITTFIGMFEIP